MRVCGRKLRWDFLERRLSSLSRRYAYIVADHPLPFIVIPIILSLVGAGGFAFMVDYIDASDLFTPQSAQSKVDQRLINSYFPQSDGHYLPGRLVVYKREAAVILLAKDRGNILRQDVSDAVIRLNEFVINNVTIEDNGLKYTYQNLCMKSGPVCHTNNQVYTIPLYYRLNDPFTNLSYPTAVHDSRERYYLGATLGGVTLDKASRRIVEAKGWYLNYKMLEGEYNELSKRFELEYQKQLVAYNDSLIDIYPVHSQTFDLEVVANSLKLRPRFTVMLSMLILFAVLCTMSWTWPARSSKRFILPVIDWTLSRPTLAFLGVIGAGMGVGSAMGYLFYFKAVYNNLVLVMPFLIIAVRLDNTFLMIAALDNTKRTLPVRERISEAMAEAAVSITITVLTDIFSFSFGILTDFLAVQIFCTYTTAAIVVTWVYQLTFLLGFLVLYARWEENHKHALAPWVSTLPVSDYDSVSFLKKILCLGSRRQIAPALSYIARSKTVSGPIVANSDFKVPIEEVDGGQKTALPPALHVEDHEEVEGTDVSRWFRDCYGRFLMKKVTKGAVVVLLLAFWGVSAYGCLSLRQGLEPIKLLIDDSYAVPYYRAIEKYFWPYGQQVQVVIFNPGDLTNATQRQAIFDVLKKFTQLPHATGGSDSIEFWLTSFSQFLERNENTKLENLPPERFYEKLNWFLYSFKDNYRYQVDVAFKNGSGPGDRNTNPIVAVRAMVGIKGFDTLIGQQESMDTFRALAAQYSPTFTISTYHIMFEFIDQYEAIWPNVAQEIYSSIICMIGMALLLIPHPVCAVWVTFAILSIDVGVVGFMTLWGLNMDTISMITIIMSIGFSVDFSAHIAYAYVVNIREEPDDRVRKALGSLGWPVLQGGVATMLGVIFLADLNSYMIVSFFKTVFLVIAFGLLHGLIFLPVLLSLLMPKRMCGFQCISSAPSHSEERRDAQNGHAATVISEPSDPKEVEARKTNRIFPLRKY